MPGLDVAILNTGISPNGYVVGTEGWKSTLQINAMATAPLGLLLPPKMKASTAATSEAHRWLELSDFPDASRLGGRILRAVSAKPNGGNKWNTLLQNARSKLFAMYSESLAALANGAGCNVGGDSNTRVSRCV